MPRKKKERADHSDTTELNLNKNEADYKYNHKDKDAVEITLHFINLKY